MKHLKLFFTNDDCLISSEREGGNSGSANLQVEKLCVCVYVSEHNQVLSSSIIYINFFISFCLFLLSVIFSLGVLFVCFGRRSLPKTSSIHRGLGYKCRVHICVSVDGQGRGMLTGCTSCSSVQIRHD